MFINRNNYYSSVYIFKEIIYNNNINMNIAIVIDDNIKLTKDRYFRKHYLKIINNMVFHLKKKFNKIDIFFTNSPMLTINHFDNNDSINNYIRDISTGYSVSDGISNIKNLEIYKNIIVIFNEDSIFNLTEAISSYINKKIHLINIKSNKLNIIPEEVNYYNYIDTNATIKNIMDKSESLEEFFVIHYLSNIGILL